MKPLRLARNLMVGKLAWSYAERVLQRRERARRNRAVGTGVVFATGAGLAWYFRDPLIAFARDLFGTNAVEKHYGEPVPPSRKKQRTAERREAAEKKAHEPHKPAAVRVEKNATPDLAVKLGEAIKH